ncbi:MAG: dihydropteroate synthase [Candidatus Helarchaeota archaeon]
MEKIYLKLFNSLEIGDDFPTIVMGVLNLSPESFYKGSVYTNQKVLKKAVLNMIANGAKILDLGARSTAPWSPKISIDEELKRIVPALETVCKIIPDNIIISIDTQFRKVAEKSFEITQKYEKHAIINDVSCFKVDQELSNYVVDNKIPVILMASKKVPGDLLTIPEIVEEFKKTINELKLKNYDIKNIILDPGIGHWIEEKTHVYDLKIIANLKQLRELKLPILVAISRKSFIGKTLNIPDPEKRLNGTLSATAIAVYNGAHIVRTHDVTPQLNEFLKMAEEIRKSKYLS